MFGFLLLGDDIDIPTRELGSEPYILSAPPDGKRELLVGHDDFHALTILIEHNFGDLGGRERVHHEVGGIGCPRDDVDLLALQLIDDGLYARTAHADAGTDRVDGGIARNHRDFRARARIPRHRLDLDDAVIDLRHFLREQFGHELRVGAREKDLRPTRLTAHVIDKGADAVAVTKGFARQHLIAAHDRLAAPEVHNHVAVFDPLDDAVDDIADAVLVFLILAVALGLAHFLHDHLLRRLGGDSAVFERGQGVRDIDGDPGGRGGAF